jgi:hypothetical protein
MTRRLVLFMHTSLDGFVAWPHGLKTPPNAFLTTHGHFGAMTPSD